jgi:hypothetical protein
MSRGFHLARVYHRMNATVRHGTSLTCRELSKGNENRVGDVEFHRSTQTSHTGSCTVHTLLCTRHCSVNPRSTHWVQHVANLKLQSLFGPFQPVSPVFVWLVFLSLISRRLRNIECFNIEFLSHNWCNQRQYSPSP